MGDCHLPLSYNNPKCEEKFCKYSYSTWCPTCDRSPPRRRSRSETTEFCRKKCKEMKSPSPRKYPKSQEYENMDLEYEYKEFWYEPKDNCRIRSNLVELPTSYITNNHQMSKLPSDKSEHVKPHEPTAKFVNSPKMKPDDLVDTYEAKLHRKSHKCHHDNHFVNAKINGCSLGERDINYETTTYFDKILDTSSFHNRYAREIEAMREKLAAYRSTARRENGTGEPKTFTPAIEKFHEKYARDVESMRQRLEVRRAPPAAPEVAPLESVYVVPEPPKSKKVVTVKTRGKVNNAAKPRNVKTKEVKNSSEISDYSGSDESDVDDSKGDDESESVSENTWSDDKTESQDSIPQPGGGDSSGWPVRPSLFPNIPPYIRFSAHDAESATKLPAGRRHFKWKLSTITPIVVRKTLTNSGFALVRNTNQWLGTWGKHMKSPMFKTLKETQKINHFPGTFQLGRKDRLWRNFQRLINRHGYKEFGFIPQTFVLPQELKLLKQNWEYKSGGNGDTWIIKPPASSRGVGIKVINKWSHLPKKTSLVVQKYISNPYLINGSKFDLRLYVLVTSFNPLRIYLYPDGLARFASAKYTDDAKDLKDRYMHLTNYSINKLSSQYTANEDANACQGHKWTLKKLLEYMEGDGVDTKALWRNLQQLVIKTVITGESPINNLCEENILNRYNCYELFGIDVLLDDKLKPWLLEVNISPSLHSASPLDSHVKGPLVQMLLDLAQFHFPPRLAQQVRQSPTSYDPKLYTTALTKKEREKHNLFVQYEERNDYLDDILTELTGDDVRRLTQAEDEFTVKGTFERIFPTSQTYKYLDFMHPRYYNRLFDAWEAKYEKNRQAGIARLRTLCADKVHLKVAPETTLTKSSPSTTLVDSSLLPSKKGQSRPLVEVMQMVTIENNPSSN